MTYIFDENLSPRIAQALAVLELPVVHVNDRYGRGAREVDFLPNVAACGWVLVTCDRHIRTRPAEKLALQRAGVTAIFMGDKFPQSPFHKQALWFLQNWEKMEAVVASSRPGTCFKATRGKIERLP